MLPLAQRGMLPLARRTSLPLARCTTLRQLAPVHAPLLVRGAAGTYGAMLSTGQSAVQRPQPVDTAWESLTDAQQSAAVVLGWSPETWSDGMHVPPLSTGLSAEQELAVRELGYTSVDDWDQIPRAWVDAGIDAEELDEPTSNTDWSGTGSSEHDDAETGGGATSALRGMVLRLLAAVLTGAALCVGAEASGLLPDAAENPKPATKAID